MNKEDNQKQPDNKKPGKETEASISNGKKMIEVQKKMDPAPPGQKEDNERADAEKWRNEG